MVELLGADDIPRAAAALAAGQLVAFPTETVYGLGADAGSAEAVARIFEAKGRPTGHPLIVHIASAEDLGRFARCVPPHARRLAEAFWPGPLTLVVERSDRVAPETVGGRATVGLRVPDHHLTIELLLAFGGGMAGPSANRFGSVSPTTAQHVIDDLGPSIDYVIDGGPSAVGVESTIVDLTGDRPLLLRPGGISAVEIEAVIGEPLGDDRLGPARAPGMLASHYAPRAPVELISGHGHPDPVCDRDALDRSVAAAVESAGGGRVGLIAPVASDHRPSWRLPSDAAGYAARLYATLRDADRDDLDLLLIAPPTDGPLLDAVIDRLTKAAAPR
ncbi:MAG: L-threonylcarbamoyladenylate synthase [Acidimicrobiales bacterium]